VGRDLLLLDRPFHAVRAPRAVRARCRSPGDDGGAPGEPDRRGQHGQRFGLAGPPTASSAGRWTQWSTPAWR
jgi:hypothetical protein